MRKTIHAQVVAKAISFPHQIEIQYQPVDEYGRKAGDSFYKEGPLTWEQVKMKFWITEAYAVECEDYFSEGSAALILRPQDIEGNWVDVGDSDHPDSSRDTTRNADEMTTPRGHAVI
jgi:hypothetical protein